MQARGLAKAPRAQRSIALEPSSEAL